MDPRKEKRAQRGAFLASLGSIVEISQVSLEPVVALNAKLLNCLSVV